VFIDPAIAVIAVFVRKQILLVEFVDEGRGIGTDVPNLAGNFRTDEACAGPRHRFVWQDGLGVNEDALRTFVEGDIAPANANECQVLE